MVLIVCAAVSIPIAFSGLHLLSYEGITIEAEFTASTHTYEHVPGQWAADDHLGRITHYHNTSSSYQLAATSPWLRGGSPPGCPTLSQHSWTTVGAQLYPKPPVAVSESVYEGFLTNRTVVYLTGTTDPITLSLPRHSTGAGC